jgi:1,2-diacylglycerol-3-alpha-glucose alpha-1,2-glucosyltransferase
MVCCMRIKFLVTPIGLMTGNIISARRLRDALLRQGVDVTDDPTEKNYDLLDVHVPIPFTNIAEVKRAKKKGIPVVMHAHTTAEDAEGVWTGSGLLSGVVGRYLTFFYNMGDLVLAPSAWTEATLRARHVKAPIQVLSNGIDLDKFRLVPERRSSFRKHYGISDDTKVVYMVGVICPKKGVEVLPAVAKQLPNLQFVWVGRRSILYYPLRVRRAMGKCPPNVLFLSDVEEALDAHCGGDIFFTPSFCENQGIALMEAMAVGRPVVARNLPVYKGLLANGRNALTCETVDEFATSLERVSKDPLLAKNFVEEGKTALLDHDMEKIAKSLVSIYSSLLNG